MQDGVLRTEDRTRKSKGQKGSKENRRKVGEMTEWREWNHSLKMAVGRVYPSGPPKSGNMAKEESSGGGDVKCLMSSVYRRISFNDILMK